MKQTKGNAVKYSTRKNMISEKDKKEFVKEAQDVLCNMIFFIKWRNPYDIFTNLPIENNIQLGWHFRDIKSILIKFEHFEGLEIDRKAVYRYLQRNCAKHDKKDISFLYFSLSFCFSMYENFNSAPVEPNFAEDYTLEINRILIKKYLIPTYLFFKYRKDTIK